MPWVRAKLHGEPVLARARDDGSFLVERGQVEVRYRQHSGRLYKARASNLTRDTDSSLLPDDACAEALPATRTRAASRRKLRAAAIAETAPASAGRVPAATPWSTTSAPVNSAAPAAKMLEPIIVYADGACSGNPGPAGLGVVLCDGATRTELSACLGVATNNIAELIAIERALQLVPDRRRSMLIHTDSSYAIGVLSKGWKASANADLIGRLRSELRQRPAVQLVHVPGHAGIELNERADALAREAVRTGKTWTARTTTAGEPPLRGGGGAGPSGAAENPGT